MITSRKDSNWVSIAEQLTVEMDEAKLAILVKQLCSALDVRQGPPTQDQTTRDLEQIAAAYPVMLRVPLGMRFER
jgi:hypothetical protein